MSCVDGATNLPVRGAQSRNNNAPDTVCPWRGKDGDRTPGRVVGVATFVGG